MTTLKTILSKIRDLTSDDREMITRAHQVAADAHRGQKRYSGEPYMAHVLDVAFKLADMGMGARTIAAGILHDSIEDSSITSDNIREQFGDEVLFLVEGVTKLGSVRYYGSDRHNESLRKLFVATSRDIRVLIIKLVDRLHNMQTLEHVPVQKQQRIARETLEIYVAVAHRLGMGRIRKELEDLAFPYVYPKEYEQVLKLTKPIRKRSEDELEKTRKSLQKKLAEVKLTDFHTSIRVKGLYSLYQKLRRRDWDMDQIHDYLAIRVVVNSIEECYRALGIIHEIWRPMPGRVKDYIAFPKPNGYRSIHTTVITPNRIILEIQIRTEEMHHDAEYGIASHVIYKDDQQESKTSASDRQTWFGSLIPSLFRPFAWRRSEAAEGPELLLKEPYKHRIPKWIQEIGDTEHEQAGEFVDELKEDFFTHRIFVFTPEGDVVDLPVGAYPLDFAYAIHSEIGDRTSGAKVNNKLVSLDTELKNGDIVEITTRKNAHPTQKWLDFSKTSLARRRIRNHLATEKNS